MSEQLVVDGYNVLHAWRAYEAQQRGEPLLVATSDSLQRTLEWARSRRPRR